MVEQHDFFLIYWFSLEVDGFERVVLVLSRVLSFLPSPLRFSETEELKNGELNAPVCCYLAY